MISWSNHLISQSHQQQICLTIPTMHITIRTHSIYSTYHCNFKRWNLGDLRDFPRFQLEPEPSHYHQCYQHCMHSDELYFRSTTFPDSSSHSLPPSILDIIRFTLSLASIKCGRGFCNFFFCFPFHRVSKCTKGEETSLAQVVIGIHQAHLSKILAPSS